MEAVQPAVRGRIEDLIAEHAWILDHGDPRMLPTLYTEQGELLGLGEPIVGRPALQAWSDQRAQLTARVSRHVHTNLHLRQVDPGTVRGDLITLLYRHEGTGAGPSWPLLVLDYADDYAVQPDDSVLFARRSITRVFVDETRQEATGR